ncbi:Crp/Fnr family transcriptional regulator [Neoactinobaculum massilliense]|uniref:Crp/Fnr family transcriptional regulator n=1 Tax=Neoactinobaculum massilliense TaxID=2364794 RepID=UPI0019CFFB12|nr:Crp/Fnr family transcriptional regulator [Neoactinobaculum massilliense]
MVNDLCVAHVPIFRHLDRKSQERIATAARASQFEPGDIIFSPDAPEPKLLVIHEGHVKISHVSTDGHTHLLRVLGPGDFAGETNVLTGERPRHFATAVDNARMCVFGHQQLMALLGDYPAVAVRMLREVSMRLTATESRLESLISGDVAARLASYLLSLPMHKDRVTLPLPKKDIASLLDTTPESLSRQLRRLANGGIIREAAQRSIELLDIDALLNIADAAES